MTLPDKATLAYCALTVWMVGILLGYVIRLTQVFAHAHGSAVQAALRHLIGG